MRIKKFIQDLYRFFFEDLWENPLVKKEGIRPFIIRTFRSVLFAGRAFFEDMCLLRASALTYYTLMTLVPVIAMFLAIAQGFGYQAHLEAFIQQRFVGQPVVIEKLLQFSDNLLQTTKGGLIAGVGFIVLFWSIIKILSHTENALNHIWGVKKARRFVRKFSDFFSLMIIAPLFFIVAGSTTLYVVSKLQGYIENLHLHDTVSSSLIFFVKLLPYALVWVLFTFIYLFLPNTKVQVLPALVGGIIGGTLYQIFQWGYLYFQIGLSRYGAIYGSFAAIPLFLIWLDLSWLCVLFGAEISHTYQNIDRYEFGWSKPHFSWKFDWMVYLWVMHQAICRFQKGKKTSISFVKEELKLPLSYVEDCFNTLSKVHLLLETAKPKQYVPSKEMNDLTIKDVLETLALTGEDDLFFSTSKLEFFHQVLEEFFHKLQEGKMNTYLKEIPHE